MSTITFDEIARNLQDFLHRVEAGEVLLVVSGTRAVAEIKPLPARTSPHRPIGLAAGEFVTPDGFDEPLPEDILEAFEPG